MLLHFRNRGERCIDACFFRYRRAGGTNLNPRTCSVFSQTYSELSWSPPAGGLCRLQAHKRADARASDGIELQRGATAPSHMHTRRRAACARALSQRALPLAPAALHGGGQFAFF